MKILIKGKIPTVIQTFYTHTCLNCHTKFEFERGELRYVGKIEGYINCPLCEEACRIVL